MGTARTIAATVTTLWRNGYEGLADAPVHEKQELKKAQEAALETNAEEDNIEQKKPPRRLRGKQGVTASFAKDGLYERPSAFIRHLMAALPNKERLTRRQTLFMVKLAQACDEAWEDGDRPPQDRREAGRLLYD